MSDPQFDPRYKVTSNHVGNPGARKRSQFVVDQERQLLSELRRRPENIAFFEERMVTPPESFAKPLIGVFCNMVPLELISAMGAVPIRLGCGNPALVSAGEEVLSGEICPLAKSSFATFLDDDSTASKCQAVIVPTSCDAKKKLGEVIGDFKPTFMFNLPPEQDYRRYGRFVVQELGRMVKFLHDILGSRLSTGALRKAIRNSQQQTMLVRELQTARAAKPAALSIRDFFLIIQSASSGGELSEWLVEAKKVLDGVKAFEPERERLRPRIILTGAPMMWPNFKVLNLIEESGADVVADTLCTGAQSCFDPVVTEERGRRALMRALAARYVFASACPCFISQATRLSRVLDLVDEFDADGVINYGLRLCQLFDIEVYRLQRVLKSRKIAFHNLRTDYSLEDTEQLRVRLEAFLETIGED
jgi:benzoyl-CoA reductase/2-hydroxyglutaryl-CoA dehydratase subunit BcrC/BadD/HgdB